MTTDLETKRLLERFIERYSLPAVIGELAEIATERATRIASADASLAKKWMLAANDLVNLSHRKRGQI